MSITITQIKAYDNNPGGNRLYEVKIGSTSFGTFEHKRIDGLAVCLEKAAKAVRLNGYREVVKAIMLEKN